MAVGNYETDTVVMLPVYNERENLPIVCQQVLRATGGQVDILIIDDNSPDGTGELADDLAQQYPQIHVLHRERKEGLGRAYVAGYRQCLRMGYSLIAQMDADLSHDPAVLPVLIECARQADLVIGSRYVEGGAIRNWPRRRIWLSAFANHYVRWVTGMPLRDATSGYRCWRREALEILQLDSIGAVGYAALVETAYRCYRLGLRIREVPIVFTERRAGASKLSWKAIIESAWTPWRLRWDRKPTWLVGSAASQEL